MPTGWELVESGLYSDFTIIEEDQNGVKKEYKVHKAILCVSPYFNTLFQAPMVEGKGNSIIIGTNEIGLLEDVLKQIYEPNDLWCKDMMNNNFNKLVDILILCDYLQLDEHVALLHSHLKEKYITGGGMLTDWYTKTMNANGIAPDREGRAVPDIINRIIIDLTMMVSVHTKRRYIPESVLLTLYPNLYEPFDPISESENHEDHEGGFRVGPIDKDTIVLKTIIGDSEDEDEDADENETDEEN